MKGNVNFQYDCQYNYQYFNLEYEKIGLFVGNNFN